MHLMKQIRQQLHLCASPSGQSSALFYKTQPGGYAAEDRFLGVSVPNLRRIAKDYNSLGLLELEQLLASAFNEERLLALLILVRQYQTSDPQQQEAHYAFYMAHLQHVNNWNLVDSSAHLIVGAHLWERDRTVLTRLAQSDTLWERRIAMIATWHFIRQGEVEWTFKIATLLLQDPHDLIHKAVGWMLREAGKREETALIAFLDHHAHAMPRTMLRYAIEKFPEAQRKYYMACKKTVLI